MGHRIPGLWEEVEGEPLPRPVKDPEKKKTHPLLTGVEEPPELVRGRERKRLPKLVEGRSGGPQVRRPPTSAPLSQTQ